MFYTEQWIEFEFYREQWTIHLTLRDSYIQQAFTGNLKIIWLNNIDSVK